MRFIGRLPSYILMFSLGFVVGLIVVGADGFIIALICNVVVLLSACAFIEEKMRGSRNEK